MGRSDTSGSYSGARHSVHFYSGHEEVSLVDASYAVDDAKIKVIDRSIGIQAIDAFRL